MKPQVLPPQESVTQLVILSKQLLKIPIYSNSFQFIPIQSNSFQFIPIYSNSFQFIPIHSNSLQFILIYSRLNEAPGPSTSRVSDSVSDIVKAAIENSDVGLKKKQVEFEKSWNSVEKEPETEIPLDNNISAGNVRPKQPAGSAMFLPSSSSTSGRPVLILKLRISLCT